MFPAKEDVGDLKVKMMCLEWGVVVASFGSVLRRTGRLPINHKDHHGLKTAGDKGAVDLSYLGMLWGGKGVGKVPAQLCH